MRMQRTARRVLLALFLPLLLGAAAASTPDMPEASIHPRFPLLDDGGQNVLDSQGAVSTMRTCGQCHDTEYIESHSFHTTLGLDLQTQAGTTSSERPWDTSPGLFGRWNPISYRYLSPPGDERLDLTTPAWVQFFGLRHVGGGPAVRSRDGRPLESVESVAPHDLETHIADPFTGEMREWDWRESGVVEMNCFLCHIPNPDNDARAAELEAGRFRWANTATLARTPVVERRGERWVWNREAFDSNGQVDLRGLRLQDPANDNCGQCHGLVHSDPDVPVLLAGCTPEYWSTITTGQLISPHRISASGMNLAGKQELTRSWDVHAERLLECTDCHFSVNNPVYRQESESSRPSHLVFDGRRLDIGEYLERPSHQFAKGQSAQGLLAPELDSTMRRCEGCHSVEMNHDWLPYKDRHFAVMSCEACHIPRLHAPARKQVDWTVLTAEGKPVSACRGVDNVEPAANVLIAGYAPVLLPRSELGGQTRLAPYNLISSWFWVEGDPARPVRIEDLRAAILPGGSYDPELVALLDDDGDGRIETRELRLDTAEKVQWVEARLGALGLANPRIAAETQPYAINHNVTGKGWAVRDCASCHGSDSRLGRDFMLALHVPGGVLPQIVKDSNVELAGEIRQDADGRLYFRPSPKAAGLYVLGHDTVRWANAVGLLALFGVVATIVTHAGLRYRSSRQLAHAGAPLLSQAYMYSAYERLWHWLQALAILALIVTGLQIHYPDTLAFFGFATAVRVHNIIGFVVIVNALFAAFYHLASGEIRQYLPAPRGFFGQAIEQAVYYVHGIFRGQPHPFEKIPERRLNPLQQITYLGILNLLLPFQVVSGLAMWGAQRWPDLAGRLGGLGFLAPAHNLGAWLFGAFLLMHLYLTTTGRTPLSNVRAMVVGWDEIEAPSVAGRKS